MDQAAVAVPALGEWMIGFPNSVNIKGAFLEDLAAAAAAHNAGRLKPPKALLPAPAVSATAKASPPPSAAAADTALYDPLGLVGADNAQQQQQAPATLAPAPAVNLPCIDGLKLLLHAGWSVMYDVLLGDGKLAAAIMSGSSGMGRRMGLGTVQVSEEGEVALRLGLAVMAAPASPFSHFTNPSSTSSSSSKKDARKPQEPHVFDVGIHLNLSQLIGVPSMQHDNQLSAARGGIGSAGRGLLLIGDLALEPSEMAEAMWRGPQLGFGLLPVSQLLLPAAGSSSGRSTKG